MASDLSSGCTDDIEIFEEKEEGELSLEDVSSSEESHPNYRSGFRNAGQCTSCRSLQICESWCAARAARKSHKKQDAAHGKENRRHSKDPSSTVSKHMVATLQEKNDDLVPISSDSDMEIVGLPGNSKQLHARPKNTKVRKKKKKKRSHSNVIRIDDSLSPTQVETYLVDVPVVKKVRPSRSHHREPSPPRYSVRSPLERPLPRSPSRRYRATRPLKSRSPLRRSRSPATRVIPADRKSPRKLRSPRRSPAPRSPVRSTFVRDSREHSSPSSQTYVDLYATKLLKKVRRLESVGGSSTKSQSKSKEHSSLKEKLSNMMKNQAEGGLEKSTSRKRSNTNIASNNNNDKNGVAAPAESDEEEDIELLRRLALETKQKKAENKIEESRAKNEAANAEESDDNDIEANELRILALRSAIMKKHQKRVTRGVKSKKPAKSENRVESPFYDDLLDDLQISEEEGSSVKSPNTRSSPILDDESNHLEDMDLDTDVEREKEKDFMPYSPTDDLTREIHVEADLPETNDNNNDDEKLSLTQEEMIVGVERPMNMSTGFLAGVDTPYSPSAPTETPILDKFVSHCPINNKSKKKSTENTKNSSVENVECTSGNNLSYLPGVDTPFSPSRSLEMPKTDELSKTKNSENTKKSCSSTNTPNLDPELFPIFPNLPEIKGNENDENSVPKIAEVDSAVVRNLAATELDETVDEVVEACKDSEIDLSNKEEKCESPLMVNSVSEISLREDSFRPIDTMDKLPEVDLDGSPLVPVSKELEGAELIIPIDISPEIVDPASEPLYLQSLSDITKDTSKIPNLVNRALVPALILKTNKQLQQPLPQKKVDNHAEPSFKSAEMRPVSVETELTKSTTLFKPIKLCPIPKKPQVMTTAAAAFNTSFGDDSAKETKSDEEPSIVEESADVKEATITATKSPSYEQSKKINEEGKKKANTRNKKRQRLRNRRKSSDTSESPVCTKQSSSGKAKSGESNSGSSSVKKVKSAADCATNERVTRASIKSTLIKSWENFKENVLKTPDDKGDNFEKATTSKKATDEEVERKKKTPKKKRRLKKKVKRLSGSSADTRGKSSDVEAKNVEQNSDKTGDTEQIETNKIEGESCKKEELKQKDDAEKKRRSSIDEDEEALRALLLASLPKRTKPVETNSSTPPVNPVAKLPQLSDTTSDTCVENSANKLAAEPISRLAESAFTPVNPSQLSSQFSASSATQSKVEGTTTNKAEVTRKILPSESNSSGVEASPLTQRKRANSVVAKGPPKKIVKKALPVLASTKVVNNAKKYQNALLQKKLNLQRAAMNYGAQNGSRNITLNNLKSNDAARPSSPKISAASKTQRLVINLGSDTDSEAELENQRTNSNSGDAQTEVRKPLTIPTTDFEKSVVQFLKDQRKKQESVTVAKSAVNSTTTTSKTVASSTSPATGKLTGLYNTPLAVRRHLPMSQQEEYRRLKQQIMERERQKLQKTIENGSASLNPSLKSPCTPPGPLSPASPIAATQKSQANQRISIVASQVSASPLAPSNKDKIPENLVMQKKIELSKANENRPSTSVTKVSKPIVPVIRSRQLAKPSTTSPKIIPNVPNVPSTASTPPAPLKITPKASSSISSASIPPNTSTPKAQAIPSKTHSSIFSRSFLPLAKSSTTESRGKFVTELPNASTKFPGESATSVSTRDEARWSLGTITVPPLPAKGITSSRSSLNHTEMLTIQIPNDKMQTDRETLTGISKGESSSPPNGRNVGMLKILTKEQLNNRFVQIQVKQGSAGRTVVVKNLSQDDVSRSGSSSPISKVLSEGRCDKTDKMMCCDSNLILNESTATRRGEKKAEESMVADPEASTLILSRDEGNAGNDNTVDSNASTVVLAHDNAHNDTSLDSAASTFVFVHNSECRESPARTEEQEDGTSATNAAAAKQTKTQVKEVWEKIRSDVKDELEILTALPEEQQRAILIESQENLVAKRNMVLDDLTEMSGCLRQLEVERDIQTKLIAEVRRLREQLRTAEKHLHEQRRQMIGMGPKVTKAHEKINHGRRECYKLSRICHGLGSKILGEDYKVPDTGAQLLNERLKEVAVHTRQLSKKKVPPIGSVSDSRDTNSPASSTGSDTVSESSFVERQSNSTTTLLETTNIEDTTISLTSETDLDTTRETRENYEPPETSNADSPGPNSISKKVDDSEDEEEEEEEDEEEEESSGTHLQSKDCAEKNAQTKDEKGSRSSETDAQTISKDQSNPSEISAQTKEKIASSSSEISAQTTTKDQSNPSEISAQMKEKIASSSSETNAQTTTKDQSNPSEITAQTKEKIASSSSECNTNDNSDIPATNFTSKDQFEDISIPSTSKSDPHHQLLSSDQQPHAKTKIDPYKSVLTHLRASRSVNPEGILCPYELMGTCSDGDCQFYHLDPRHCQ